MSRISMTFPSSDLSRKSARVFSVAEQKPVRVTRRDGQDLVLMTEREDSLRDELLHLAAELIAVGHRGVLNTRGDNPTGDNGTLITSSVKVFTDRMIELGSGFLFCFHVSPSPMPR